MPEINKNLCYLATNREVFYLSANQTWFTMKIINNISAIIKKNSFKPNKLLGQNFLISKKFREKIVETAKLSPEDTVIEVGAGDGTLTFELAKKAKLVLAVEKDKKLALLLQKTISERKITPPTFQGGTKPHEKNLKPSPAPTTIPRDTQKGGGVKNIIVINEDILKFVPDKSAECLRGYKLIGNIPYYLTSRLLKKFLAEEKLKPEEIILTVQKEVAERIVARPPHMNPVTANHSLANEPSSGSQQNYASTKHQKSRSGNGMNILAISVQAFGKPEIIEKIPADAFWPKPKVDSAIIKISKISDDFFAKNKIEQKTFFSIIKTAFSQKRKVLANSLAKYFKDKKTAEEKIIKAKLSPNSRPEELSLEDWLKLIK